MSRCHQNKTRCAIQTVLAGLLITLVASSASAAIIADSAAEFTTTGTQGENDWFNGYYNLTADGDATYQTTDLTLFTNPTHWTGSQWDLGGGAPWTSIGSTSGHPNGTNNAVEHWGIRRWVSDVKGTVDLIWEVRKANTNGLGVSGELFLNGMSLDFASIAGNDLTGVTNTVSSVFVNHGDIIDLALTPEGPSGNREDGSDGSFFQLSVDSVNLIPEPSSYAMAILALVGLGGVSWRKRSTIARK